MIPAAEWDAAWGRHLAAPDDAARARLAAWLRVDHTAVGGFFAMMPFVRMETDDGPAIGAALLPPMVFYDDAEVSLQHHERLHHFLLASFGVDDEGQRLNMGPRPPLTGVADRIGKCASDSPVLLVDRGALHRVRGSDLILPPNAEFDSDVTDLVLYTNARVWARDWARRRQELVHRINIAARDYRTVLTEAADECYPGALLIGDPAKVRWPAGITFACPDDATAKAVTRAIYRQANLPRAVVAPRPSHLREAA